MRSPEVVRCFRTRVWFKASRSSSSSPSVVEVSQSDAEPDEVRLLVAGELLTIPLAAAQLIGVEIL
jgi:hypothetical protein